MTTGGYQERIALGERLAPDFADPEVAEQLVTLLLDPEDTAVTLYTALALLKQHDPQAIRLLVVASGRADDDTNDEIQGAFSIVRAEALGEDDEFLRRSLAAIHNDPDPDLAGNAREWSSSFGFSKDS